MGIDRIFTVFNIAASGLSAQREQMEVTASNIANAETLETPEGGPYRRRAVRFREVGVSRFSHLLQKEAGRLGRFGERILSSGLTSLGHRKQEATGVEAKQYVDNDDVGHLVYDPGHPMANAEGYVQKPDVNLVQEMVTMISATRAYEANVSVIQAAKNMAKKALEI